MRFSVVATALFAGLAAALPSMSAESTVYMTEEVTITSCAATVTDCPARSSSTPMAMSSSVAPVMTSSSVAPVMTSSSAPSVSVIAISTCVPTVMYSTMTLTPTMTPSVGTTGMPTPSGVSAKNATATTTTAPIFTGAASSVQGSFALAGAAAAAAFFLA